VAGIQSVATSAAMESVKIARLDRKGIGHVTPGFDDQSYNPATFETSGQMGIRHNAFLTDKVAIDVGSHPLIGQAYQLIH